MARVTDFFKTNPSLKKKNVFFFFFFFFFFFEGVKVTKDWLL